MKDIQYGIEIHRKNDFAEVSKNLDIDLKIISDYQNNYVRKSSIISNAQSFDILAINLSVLRNHLQSNKIIFRSVFFLIFKYFNEIFRNI